MDKEIRRIPYDEFFRNPASIFEQVIRDHETVIVEYEEGEAVILSSAEDGFVEDKTEDDLAAFRAAAGSWAEVDTDTFLADVYESRHRPSRPPVQL
jgi:PHD/YefM family antitoxin component YafN of YafNO toxin-antitoxin module